MDDDAPDKGREAAWADERRELLAERDALSAERDALRAERDKLQVARDAILREVLPLSGRAAPGEERRPRRVGLLIVVAALAGGVGLLLYKSSRTMQAIQQHGVGGAPGARAPLSKAKSRRAAEARRRRTIRSGAQPASARISVLPQGSLSVLGPAALLPGGRWVALGGWDGRLALYDLRRERVVFSIKAHRGALRALCAAGTDRVVTGGADGKVALWSVARRGQLRVLRDKGPAVRSLACRGDLVAVGGEAPEVTLYPLPRGKPRSLKGHRAWVRAVALGPRGKLLASAGHDRVIRLWEVSSGELLRTLAGHRLWVSALTFSPDGETLASAGFDKRTRLWEVQSGKRLHSLRGHVRRPIALAFDASGRRLASAGLDRTIVLWDVARGRLLRRLRGHRYQITSVAFDPRGRFLLSASTDGSLRLWGAQAPVPPIWRRLPAPRPGELTFRNNTTGERARIRLVSPSGQVLSAGRRALARVLRSGPDDRIRLPDPKLVELLVKVSERFGRKREIVVISGHRSPQFNALRTKQSKQVAKESRHVRGQAIDFRISGVAITTLHRWLKKQRWGGLGLYPDSNFVHLDTGPVRLWTGN